LAVFRFHLRPVLRQREIAEREHQLRVASIERDRLGLEAELRVVQGQIEQEQNELNGLVRAGAVDPMLARQQGGAIAALQGKAQRLAVQLASVYRRLDQARKMLTEAAMHRRSMELLRDQQAKRWRLEQDRAEDQAMDELMIMRAGRASEGER